MNSVRHMSGCLAKPASGHSQPAAFASGHLTGCIRSPKPLVSFTSRGASFHLINKASMHPHTPSLCLRVYAMFVYFYPSQSTRNEREAERTQGSLFLLQYKCALLHSLLHRFLLHYHHLCKCANTTNCTPPCECVLAFLQSFSRS